MPKRKKNEKKKVTSKKSQRMTEIKLIFHDKSKFWSMRVNGADTILNYGKTGKNGATKTVSHANSEKPLEYFNKYIKKKKEKGYSEQTITKKKQQSKQTIYLSIF